MTAPTTDAVSSYLAVLRGVGLDESEIRRLHGATDGGSAPLDRVITEAVAATTAEGWHDHLVGTLCRSPQGLDLPRFYKSQAAADAIAKMARGHGYEATVEPRQGREFALELTDELTGETDHVMIGYPQTELGADNLPALLAAIEQTRFAADGLTVALLSTTERWQAVLVEQSALEGLKEQFGDRIEPFDRPLLADATPLDFVIDPPVPGQAPDDRLDDPSEVDLDTWLENATEESTEEVIEALESSGTKRVVAENKSDDVLAAIEEPAEAPPHESATTSSTDSTGVENTRQVSEDPIEPGEMTLPDTDRLDAEEVPSSETTQTSVHASDDLDPEDLDVEDPFEQETEPATDDDTEEELSAIGGGPKKTVSTEGIDEVFEKLEDEAVDPEDLAKPVSRVETEPPSLDSAFSDDELDDEFGSLSGGGPKRSVSSTSADDILSSAGDGDFDSFSNHQSSDHVETDPDSLLEAESETDLEADSEPAETDEQTTLDSGSDEMDDFVGDGLVGPNAASTSSNGDEESVDDSLDEIEGLADRVAERLSGGSTLPDSREWTEATDGGPGGGSQTASVRESTAESSSTATPTSPESDEAETNGEDASLEQFRFPGRESEAADEEDGDTGFAIPDDEIDLEGEKPQSSSTDESESTAED